MGNDAGVRDYQGVLPTLKSSPEVTPTLLAVGDRIKNCFDAFDCSTPRALYEPDVCITSSDVPVASESEKPSSSPRLWEPYTPLKPRAAHDAAHRVGVWTCRCVQMFCMYFGACRIRASSTR